jgi:hypothetical protein
MSDLVESALAVKRKFGHQFLAVQSPICRSILRIEIIRLPCSEGVRPDSQEIMVMVVTGLEMRSTSRAGDDETPSKKAGTSKTTVISVHRLARVPLRGAIEWKCRPLGASESDCSPDLSFEDVDPEGVQSFHRGIGDARPLCRDCEAEDE